MGDRRLRKEVETDNEVHALLLHGKNMYQTHLAKKGRHQPLTIKDYLRAITHDLDPEAIAVMRTAAQLHHLQPGELETFLKERRDKK